jgi:predicted dehydrogenase
VTAHEPLAAELEAFVTIVREGGRPIVDGSDGLWALGTARALLTAAAERHPVDLSGLSARLAIP